MGGDVTYVYILTNESMPGLVKIGRTSTSVEQRMSELNRHAGIPLPFVCYYAARVTDSAQVEKKLHEAFGDHRIRAQREFFRLSPHRAQAALELVIRNHQALCLGWWCNRTGFPRNCGL